MQEKTILDKAKKVYQSCTSYSDCGLADLIDRNGNVIEQLKFRTEFQRPDFFRFDWQDYGPNRGKTQLLSTLWFDGSKAIMRRFAADMTEVELPSLGQSLSLVTGCSAGAVSIIAPLLFDYSLGGPKHILELTQPKIVAEEQNHYVLEGSILQENDLKLWISSHNFSMLKVERCSIMSGSDLKAAHDEFVAREERMAKLLGRAMLANSLSAGGFADKKNTTRYSFSEIRIGDKVDVATLGYSPLAT
jgi:hypothetical protein